MSNSRCCRPQLARAYIRDCREPIIIDAMRTIESVSCFKFVVRTSEEDYINIKREKGCWSRFFCSYLRFGNLRARLHALLGFVGRFPKANCGSICNLSVA